MIRVLFVILFLMSKQFIFCQIKEAVQQKPLPPNAIESRKPLSTAPTDVAKNNAVKLKQSLKLNEAQYSELYKVLVTYETNIDIVGKSKLPKANQFKKMNEYSKIRQQKMKEILTKEQYNNYIMSFP